MNAKSKREVLSQLAAGHQWVEEPQGVGSFYDHVWRNPINRERLCVRWSSNGSLIEAEVYRDRSVFARFRARPPRWQNILDELGWQVP